MKKLLAMFLAALCMVLCLVPMTALAETETTVPAEPVGNSETVMPVVTIDVGGANTENEDYKIDDTGISLLKRNVQYVLTGTTDKRVSVWGNDNSEEGLKEAHYIKLDNATINGGIVVENSPVKMVVEVANGTVNTVKRLSANDLTISGSGTLNAEDLSTTQKTSYMPSRLTITDTEINVTIARNYAEWNGECVVGGNAKVTYTTDLDYAPLHMGESAGDDNNSFTLKDNAKLYCLHQNPDQASNSSVSGLEIFHGDLTLEGNSYLEAQGRPSNGQYAGYGIIAPGNVFVKDNAEIKTTATDVALSVVGALEISGGTVTAESKGSNGIYAGGAITITNGAEVKATGFYPAIYTYDSLTIDGSTVAADSKSGNGIYAGSTIGITNGAEVKASGYYPAIWAEEKITIDGSTVEAKSEAEVGIYSRNDDIEIKNSIVKADAAEDCDGILADGDVTVEGSWIETSGDETYGENIKDSVRFNGKNGTVIGNAKLPGDVTVEDGMTLTIPKDASLSVGQGNKLTNKGGIKRNGALTKDGGEIICVKHFGNAVWTFDDKTHTKTWDCCGLVEVQGEEHEMNGGVCAKCGYRVNQSVYPDYDEPTVKPSQTEAPVQNNPAQDDDLKAPKTGESSLMMLYALLLMSGAAAVIAVKKLAK